MNQIFNICIILFSLSHGYGKFSYHDFSKDAGMRFKTATHVFVTSSRIACCLACAEKPGCTALSYSARFQTCELAQAGSAVVSHLSWDVYRKNGGCLQGWDVIGNACFYFDDIARNHADAKSNCTSRWLHSTLVDLKTSAKTIALEEWLISKTIDQGVWLGGGLNIQTETYIWTDGQTLSSGFMNWAAGEPNAPATELCIGALVQADQQWCDVPCDTYLLHGVCEYPLV